MHRDTRAEMLLQPALQIIDGRGSHRRIRSWSAASPRRSELPRDEPLRITYRRAAAQDRLRDCELFIMRF